MLKKTIDDGIKFVYSSIEILGALCKFYENLYTSQLPLNEKISTYTNVTKIK